MSSPEQIDERDYWTLAASQAVHGRSANQAARRRPYLQPWLGLSRSENPNGTGPAKEAESAKPKPDQADPYMKLSAVKHVAPTCP